MYIRVPVKLPQSTGLQRHNRRRQGLGDGEIVGIHNGDGTAASRCRGRRMLRKLVHIGAVAFEFAVWARNFALAHIFLQNIWGWRWHVIENRRVHTEISCQNIFGGMSDPIINGKRCPFIFRQPSLVTPPAHLPSRFKIPCECVSTQKRCFISPRDVPSSNASKYSFSSSRPRPIKKSFRSLRVDSNPGSNAPRPLENTRYLLLPRCRLGSSHVHRRPI